jgi:hypothetical protein
MGKYEGHYTSREQEVLDSPDYYLIRCFQQKKGWTESLPMTAKKTLDGFQAIRAKFPTMRMSLYAARKLDDEIRLANVTPAYLSALVELKAAQ